MIKKIEKGIPSDMNDRVKEEQKVYHLLSELGISFLRADHDALFSRDGYEEISKAIGAKVCKNLFLANRQQTEFYLLRMPGDKKFKTKELSNQIHSARLSFGNQEALEKYLHAEKGYCSILDLRNDTENKVKLLVDKDLFEDDSVGVHPCINTSSLALKWKDLLEVFLPSIHHAYQLVTLVGED